MYKLTGWNGSTRYNLTYMGDKYPNPNSTVAVYDMEGRHIGHYPLNYFYGVESHNTLPLIGV